MAGYSPTFTNDLHVSPRNWRSKKALVKHMLSPTAVNHRTVMETPEKEMCLWSTDELYKTHREQHGHK